MRITPTQKIVALACLFLVALAVAYFASGPVLTEELMESEPEPAAPSASE